MDDIVDGTARNGEENGSAAEIRAEHEAGSGRPVIDDVLDEVAGVREELARGGDDFGVGIDGGESEAPRPRARKPRAPRTTTRRTREPGSAAPPAPADASYRDIDDDRVPSYESIAASDASSRSAEVPLERTESPARELQRGPGNDFGPELIREFASYPPEDAGRGNDRDRVREPGDEFPHDDAADAGGSGGEGGGDVGEDGQRRRRRRRRGRGGRNGEGESNNLGGRPAPQQQQRQGGQNSPGGYNSGGQTGGHRGQQGRYGNQQSGRGPQQGGGRGGQGRFDRNNRSAQPDRGLRDRGPRYNNAEGGERAPVNRGPEVVQPAIGILELHPKGYGFLRESKSGYTSQPTDSFVSSQLIEKFKLREGVQILGESVSGGRGQGPRLKTIEAIEGRTPEEYAQIKPFDELTAVSPFEQIRLETGASPVTMRVMDLLTPIGKGQRALIVAPPRSGKTMLLQEIADSVSTNHPEVTLIVLLIDERPEEVTEMRRRVRGEVIASSMDREVESHVRVSQLIFERARRMAESGRDVFVLLDSITRTARAFNKWTSNTGRTMSGGLDVKAMDIPKKMFGTARRFEEGGSLTVVGTALIDTGSRMDDVIFQEFKGTGNMELVLSRDLADRRIWPAIDISKSGTRREELILAPDVLEGVTMLRRSLISMNPTEAMEQLIRIMSKYKSNAEFLAKVKAML